MKEKKFFVRYLNDDSCDVVVYDDLLEILLNASNWPVRVIPFNENGRFDHSFEFLVGDDYSLSFLFNDKNY